MFCTSRGSESTSCYIRDEIGMNKKQLVIGILAHVDAGKTTLSESILYHCGVLRQMGRVDHKDAFLDTNHLEKDRGITIFSKQACFSLGEYKVTLLDTPGHVDFSAEMERTLPLLDYAILVVNGADGVQGHTKTLWNLLKQYQVPAFVFVNKMDQDGTNRQELLEHLQNKLSSRIVDMTEVALKKYNAGGSADFKEASNLRNECELQGNEEVLESLAVCDDNVMECYLENGIITRSQVIDMVASRQAFPCYFGSALKSDGVDKLLEGLASYAKCPEYPEEFAARVYKIARDEQGNRLTYLKVTGGTLNVKDMLSSNGYDKEDVSESEKWQEKVNQIRIYSGASYETVNQAEQGTVCAVTGLTKTYAGEGLGAENYTYVPMLSPVLNYQIQLPEGVDAYQTYLKLKQIEEEEPLLHIVWKETSKEIHGELMGAIQCEILKSMVLERFGLEIAFGEGTTVYKETLTEPVEGVGHFEPLRHYAEVHLLLEPGALGSGLQFDVKVSEDKLARNWQRLILTHLAEKPHIGVLTGSEITDMKITVTAGRAHKKHTEGGDFRQATYRAVRQGLKMAEAQEACCLLEPVYAFTLEIPADKVGRAMTDIEKMHGKMNPPEVAGEVAVITGKAPVSTMREYHQEVLTYTKGMGHLNVTLSGYEPCHNEEEVRERIAYDSEADVENPTGSVFCAHGAGYVVPWYEVREHMHVESDINTEGEEDVYKTIANVHKSSFDADAIGDEAELEAIFLKTYGPDKRRTQNSDNASRVFYGTGSSALDYEGNQPEMKKRESLKDYEKKLPKTEKKDKYLLVDGYNVIFAWEELNHLAQADLHGARNRLMDIMCNYQAYKKINLILVFDAYKVQGGLGEAFAYHNIHVVYTKEAETADQYIEKVTHEMGRRYDVTVATSDALEQLIVLGNGAKRISANGLLEEVEAVNEEIRQHISKNIW